MKRERRYLTREIRLDDSSGKPKITGYASVFNNLSQDLGGFRERIAPGAFDACLAESPDVRALYNHDANIVLGRTKSGTLTLSVDDMGLAYSIDPPDTQAARDLMVTMQRGDVDQSSFGFYCLDDTWDNDPETNGLIRTVTKASVFDVSPVTYPAYTDASSQVRTLFPDGVIELPQIEVEIPAPPDDEDDELMLTFLTISID